MRVRETETGPDVKAIGDRPAIPNHPPPATGGLHRPPDCHWGAGSGHGATSAGAGLRRDGEVGVPDNGIGTGVFRRACVYVTKRIWPTVRPGSAPPSIRSPFIRRRAMAICDHVLAHAQMRLSRPW